MGKNRPAMQETRVRSLGWEDPSGEGNGNPLQQPCLENPMDRGTWRATVLRVFKGQTRLKRLSMQHVPANKPLNRHRCLKRGSVCGKHSGSFLCL